MRLRLDDVGRGFLYVVPRRRGVGSPPAHVGARWSRSLTPRASRQIKGAALKAVALGVPLTTFITFTVRQEDRHEFLQGERVLGREVRRTINALKEWLRRRGLPSFVYVWVAENKGDRNPHVHMLTSYKVPRSEFDAFAKHLESLWGFGFAKIERIRDPKRAGHYLLKALGYALKGTDGAQGAVKGNRYGISREIMPRYLTYDLSQVGEAAERLQWMQEGMGDGDIQEIGEGLYLTKWGLSLTAGMDLGEALRLVMALNRPST